MGIFYRISVAYLQSKGYIDESVQKVGFTGYPECVKRCLSISKAIQDVKQNKTSLNGEWCDLAKASVICED